MIATLFGAAPAGKALELELTGAKALAPSYDVLVVGSGAAGMTAALAAASTGADVAVLDKGDKFGGSTSLSGGQLWIPNNRLAHEAGLKDSKEAAMTYLTRLAKGRASQRFIQSFVDESPNALEFLQKVTPLRPALRENEPDYLPEWDGGMKGGRTLDPGLFDGRSLAGEYRNVLHNPHYHLPGGLHTTSLEFEMVMRGETIPGLKERKPSTLALGEALAGALRRGLMDAGVPLFLGHRAAKLHVKGGRVVGLDVATPRGRKSVRAERGVILAAGGFEWNLKMKREHLYAPSENSAGALTNTGDGITMGVAAGAETALMDEAWWFTLILRPGEKRGWLSTSERTLPGSIMVNRKGKRFADEAMNYLDLTKSMLGGKNMPSFLVFDSGYLAKYPVGGRTFRRAPKWIRQGKTLAALAKALGIDGRGLIATVAEFNRNARGGRDPLFHRGESQYDRHWGDPSAPHPTLGPLTKAPYYGVRMLAGDIGTKGGILTDEVGRALGRRAKAIPGLYAVGNNAASVMGPGYAGSGATLGPCCTFGYLAGLDCAEG